MNDQKMDYSNQIHQRPQLEHPRQNEKETQERGSGRTRVRDNIQKVLLSFLSYCVYIILHNIYSIPFSFKEFLSHC